MNLFQHIDHTLMVRQLHGRIISAQVDYTAASHADRAVLAKQVVQLLTEQIGHLEASRFARAWAFGLTVESLRADIASWEIRSDASYSLAALEG